MADARVLKDRFAPILWLCLIVAFALMVARYPVRIRHQLFVAPTGIILSPSDLVVQEFTLPAATPIWLTMEYPTSRARKDPALLLALCSSSDIPVRAWHVSTDRVISARGFTTPDVVPPAPSTTSYTIRLRTIPPQEQESEPALVARICSARSAIDLAQGNVQTPNKPPLYTEGIPRSPQIVLGVVYDVPLHSYLTEYPSMVLAGRSLASKALLIVTHVLWILGVCLTISLAYRLARRQ